MISSKSIFMPSSRAGGLGSLAIYSVVFFAVLLAPRVDACPTADLKNSGSSGLEYCFGLMQRFDELLAQQRGRAPNFPTYGSTGYEKIVSNTRSVDRSCGGEKLSAAVGAMFVNTTLSNGEASTLQMANQRCMRLFQGAGRAIFD